MLDCKKCAERANNLIQMLVEQRDKCASKAEGLAATDSQHMQHAIAALRSALSTLPVKLWMVEQIVVAFELELQQHASA